MIKIQRLTRKMKAKSIIGLGFGDEGKGITTDYLCSKSKNPLVIRFSGGQQAGHTVILNNKQHVFSNFGSGTLRGIPTYWSKKCTIDPIGLINELNILIKKNINPILYIDKSCPITTPYDMLNNQRSEKNNNHGSCGVGFGSTIERENNKYSLTFEDLFYSSILSVKLDLIKRYYGFNEKIILMRFMECIFLILKHKNIKLVNSIPSQFDEYIFEGSQGLLLDQNIGFFPHVTRSNTGTKNILEYTNDIELFLVTRAYQTRHGNGPMTNENLSNNIILDPGETNINNKYQGKFRRSLLDLDLLQYGINKDEYIRENKKTLVITCIDHIVNKYTFTYKNNLIYSSSENEFIHKISKVLGIKNIYISKTNESKHILKWQK